jgi:hypothetical protein
VALTLGPAQAQQGAPSNGVVVESAPPPIVVAPPPFNAAAPTPPPPPPPPPAKPKPAPVETALKPPAPPPGPPPPVRSPIAVMRVLDKVTAETLRFEAPVGRRVRFKTLIFSVKACETRGVHDPEPRPSAYVVIETQPEPAPGIRQPAPREIFKGWMFANGPDLHPFEHPIYDAWLDVCVGA